MLKPLPSIKKILSDNKLVKGKLQMSVLDLRKIFIIKQKQENKIQKAIKKEKINIEKSLSKIKKSKIELRGIQETLKKAFNPASSNISLLYKAVGENKYVKARFYWHGEQREVQVGSIDNIIKIINNLFYNGYLKEKPIQYSKKMKWEELCENKNFVMATKEIAALKLQEYILRKLSKEKINYDHSDSLNVKKDELKLPDTSNHEKYDWYEEWREKNL